MVERINGGDVTRHQLRDIPDADPLYFTMLNSNKRSITRADAVMKLLAPCRSREDEYDEY
jgi:hypothetical protein